MAPWALAVLAIVAKRTIESFIIAVENSCKATEGMRVELEQANGKKLLDCHTQTPRFGPISAAFSFLFDTCMDSIRRYCIHKGFIRLSLR